MPFLTSSFIFAFLMRLTANKNFQNLSQEATILQKKIVGLF